jgi:hypothetical protein
LAGVERETGGDVAVSEDDVDESGVGTVPSGDGAVPATGEEGVFLCAEGDLVVSDGGAAGGINGAADARIAAPSLGRGGSTTPVRADGAELT